MPEFNPAHRTPPPETTPEEAERNKRISTQNEASQKHGDTQAEIRGTAESVKTPDPGKATA